MTNLHKFQEQQKQMEELNKQKKAKLAEAIQQRCVLILTLSFVD